MNLKQEISLAGGVAEKGALVLSKLKTQSIETIGYRVLFDFKTYTCSVLWSEWIHFSHSSTQRDSVSTNLLGFLRGPCVINPLSSKLTSHKCSFQWKHSFQHLLSTVSIMVNLLRTTPWRDTTRGSMSVHGVRMRTRAIQSQGSWPEPSPSLVITFSQLSTLRPVSWWPPYRSGPPTPSSGPHVGHLCPEDSLWAFPLSAHPRHPMLMTCVLRELQRAAFYLPGDSRSAWLGQVSKYPWLSEMLSYIYLLQQGWIPALGKGPFQICPSFGTLPKPLGTRWSFCILQTLF